MEAGDYIETRDCINQYPRNAIYRPSNVAGATLHHSHKTQDPSAVCLFIHQVPDYCGHGVKELFVDRHNSEASTAGLRTDTATCFVFWPVLGRLQLSMAGISYQLSAISYQRAAADHGDYTDQIIKLGCLLPAAAAACLLGVLSICTF